MQAQRYFNTSGPNIPAQHYTLMRPDLVAKGEDMVRRERYFTIWRPGRRARAPISGCWPRNWCGKGIGSCTSIWRGFPRPPSGR